MVGHLASRVVVVGAGHNGLVCAIRLARAGREVLVLEAAAAPGGGVRSAEGPPGFVHDVCSGFFPLARASPALRDVPVRWIVPDVAMVHPFLGGGEAVLHRDVGETARSLDALAPGAGAAWERLAGHGAALAEALLGPLSPRRALRALPLARAALLPAARLGDELGGPAVGAWLAGTTMHSDLGPDDRGGAGLALALHLLGHAVGWPIVAGGAQRITDALVAELRAAGGELRCGAPVTRIEGRAVVARGERIPAAAVVSTLSAGELARLLPDGALPPRLMRRLRRWRYGPATVKVDFALSGPVPWTSEPARRAAVVQLGDTLDAMRREPPLIVGQQSLHDPSRAPAGKHTLYVYTRAAHATADRIEERIERFAPGFRALVEHRAARVEGDLAGGSCRLDQQLVLRPAPRLCRYRTPLPGLYVAGPSTPPGPGVHGVSGAGAAEALQKL